MKTENRHIDQIRQVVDVVLIRHAQSEWNLQNRFTGWANPPLTNTGVDEAINASHELLMQGYRFDVAYSSRLQRAVSTMDIILNLTRHMNIPRLQDWRLNERHYGKLQGINKAEAMDEVGEYQVWRWRRGYEDMAEPLLRTDPGHPVNDPNYADLLPGVLPDVENLAQTRLRVVQFWQQQVVPRIKKGERILISAHGNTLRALLMELANMTVDEVEGFEIPTATPIIYRFDHDANPLHWDYLDRQLHGQQSA